jgi:hypothetical protein
MFNEALAGAATDMAKEMGYRTATKKGVTPIVKQESIVSKIMGFIRSKKNTRN